MSFISSIFIQNNISDGNISNLISFIPFIFMLAILYLILIRPQMKRQKEHNNMISSMTKGDEVLTSGGIVGKVIKIGESYITIEISNGVEVFMQKSLISLILPKGTIKSL